MREVISSRLTALVKDGEELLAEISDQNDDDWVDDADVTDHEMWLASVGTLSVAFCADAEGSLLTEPDFQTRGVLLPDEDVVLDEVRLLAKRVFRQAVQDGLLTRPDALRERVRHAMTRFLGDRVRQRVVCTVLLAQVPQ